MVQFKKSGKLSAPVSFTVLDKLIDVIYDIPVDIDSRLENVLSSVSVEIKDLEVEIRDSLDNLSNIRLSATDVRDETKIAQLVRQTESLDSLELLPKREKLRELMKARTSINLLTTVSNYAKCLGDLERSVDEQSKLDKRLKGKTKPKGSGDNQAEIDSLMKEASSIERQFIKDRDVFYSAIDESQIVKDKLSELCPDELEIIRGIFRPYCYAHRAGCNRISPYVDFM
jgi:chromosome segregation ATPase